MPHVMRRPEWDAGGAARLRDARTNRISAARCEQAPFRVAILAWRQRCLIAAASPSGRSTHSARPVFDAAARRRRRASAPGSRRAHGNGAAGRRSGGRRPLQQGDREQPFRHRPHRRRPPQERVRQAGNPLPPGRGREIREAPVRRASTPRGCYVPTVLARMRSTQVRNFAAPQGGASSGALFVPAQVAARDQSEPLAGQFP
jgi:hypothetical protein